MAKPIEGIPPFKGKAAKWLAAYMRTAQPDPEKAKQLERDRQIVKERVRRLPR